MEYYNFNNKYISPKPYTAKNMMIKTLETPQPPEETQISEENGTLSVGVFTALGALPVENASVIVYRILDGGQEQSYSQQTTDSSGKVADITLPVIQEPLDTSKYYFTTYNMRVIAQNYYTVNVLNFRIFPGIKTNYKVDMIPVVAGETGAPEQTYIIPPSIIDRSNE
jgi:5-hydroxyisourate hydrolase-like protein (transthyretin family)